MSPIGWNTDNLPARTRGTVRIDAHLYDGFTRRAALDARMVELGRAAMREQRIQIEEQAIEIRQLKDRIAVLLEERELLQEQLNASASLEGAHT